MVPPLGQECYSRERQPWSKTVVIGRSSNGRGSNYFGGVGSRASTWRWEAPDSRGNKSSLLKFHELLGLRTPAVQISSSSKLQGGAMSLLAASSLFSVFAAHSVQLRASKLQIPLRTGSLGSFGGFGHGGVVWSPFGGSGLVDHRHRLCSLSERASDLAADWEGADLGVEVGVEDEGDVTSRGRKFILSCLLRSVSVGVLAFTVAAVAVVSRNRRPGFATTAAVSEQMCVVNEEQLSSAIEILPSVLTVANEINVVKETLPSTTKALRSLFFASTSLPANEGLTPLENQKIDEASQEFDAWVDNVKRDALNEGVSEGVLNWALEDVTVSKDSVVHRKTAPEVKLTLDAYLKRMVVDQRVSIGASRLKENSELLTEVSQKFGVPSHFLVAIWGIETNYGSFMGNWDIIQSLATMGFTEELETRRKYFRGELLQALVMLQNGTAERGTGPQGEKRLRGSWAGAMGQCQFMPTSFRDYAIDYDGDGRKDIWESKADVFASIANYFKEHGWKTGGPIFQKVQVPKKLDKSLLGVGVVKSVLDWEHKHGVHLNPGKAPPLPPDKMASLLMPNGPKGDAYLVCENFRVILRYNSSDLYGFAVCELARLIQERASNPYPTPQLSS